MGNCSSTSNCNPCGPDFSAINQLATKAGAYARQANTYATNAENSWLEFNALYLGAFADEPMVDNEGDPLQVGALYWNTGSNELFAWNGTVWVATNFNEFTPFLATGTTFARNLVTREADVINVKDFGAVGDWDGVTGTNNNTFINTAISFCIANNKSLNWPDGNYLTTASIPDFHIVKHFGEGVVVRTTNANKLYISNKNTKTNLFYVSVSGNDLNDGLSSSEPVATLQKAVNNLQNYTLTGAWEINLAAGSYSTINNRKAVIGNEFWPANVVNSTAYTENGIVSDNFITIKGPDVGYDPATNSRPVPTAVFEGSGAALIGIVCRGVNVIFRDIKFREYNGSSSSSGISAVASNIRTINVHTANCYYGISSANGRCEIYGGSIYGNLTKTNTYGIRSIFNNYHAVGRQDAGTTNEGPLISFCTQGALIQENSTGHFDYCSIEDNIDGLRITNSSRVNCTGSNFKRNNRAIRADFDSNIYRENTIFNTNTSDANNENIIAQTYSSDIARNAYSNSGTGTDYLTTPETITGTLTSTPILSKILEQGTFAPVLSSIRKPQQIKFIAYGSILGTAAVKQFKLRLGSTILASITNTSTDTGDWVCEGYVTFTSPSNQTAMISYYSHSGTQKINVDDAGSENMNSSDKTLTFEVQLVDVTDSVTVTMAQFEVWG